MYRCICIYNRWWYHSHLLLPFGRDTEDRDGFIGSWRKMKCSRDIALMFRHCWWRSIKQPRHESRRFDASPSSRCRRPVLTLHAKRSQAEMRLLRASWSRRLQGYTGRAGNIYLLQYEISSSLRKQCLMYLIFPNWSYQFPEVIK